MKYCKMNRQWLNYMKQKGKCRWMFCLPGYLGFAGSGRDASEGNVWCAHFELVGPVHSSKTNNLDTSQPS